MGWSCSWSTVYIPQKGLLRMSNIWSWGILCREDCKFHLLFHFPPPLFLGGSNCIFMPFMTYGGSYCTATLQLFEQNFEIATLNDASVETLGRSRLISYKILIVLDIWVSCWWDFYEAFSEGASPISLFWLFTNQKCQKENLFITWLQSQLAKCINSSFLLHNLEWICNWRSIPNSSPNWIQLSRFIKQTHSHHCWMHLLKQGSYL